MTTQKYWIRVGIVGLVLLVSWVIYVSSKQIARNGRIENEVSMLQNEADKIRRENETLGEKIAYFSSADFREQEAKEKLGMKKEHEEVVVIKEHPQSEVLNESGGERPMVTDVFDDTTPNYRKWWQVFFGHS